MHPSQKGSIGRVLETAFEKVLTEGFLEGVLQWALMGRRVLRRVLRRGSKKGAFEKAPRRQKYAFSRVRPRWRVPY